jgi:hypothetical protein
VIPVEAPFVAPPPPPLPPGLVACVALSLAPEEPLSKRLITFTSRAPFAGMLVSLALRGHGVAVCMAIFAACASPPLVATRGVRCRYSANGSSKPTVEEHPATPNDATRATIAIALRNAAGSVFDPPCIDLTGRREYGRRGPGGLPRSSRSRCSASCARYRPSGTGRRHSTEAPYRTGSPDAAPDAQV